jgi:ABC-2 type transport system permease protein
MDLILWGLTTKWISNMGGDVPNLLLMMLTAIVFWQIVWRANYEISVNLLEEFWNRNMLNLFASPLKLREWVVGVMTVGIVKTVLTIAVGFTGSWILYELNIFQVGYYFIPFMVSLIMFGWAIGFFASGLIVFYGPRVQTIAWTFGFLLAPFSAVYYPLEVLPGWAQTIGKALPTTYVFEGMRQVLKTAQMPYGNLSLSFGLNILYLAVSIYFFSVMFEKSRAVSLDRKD